MEMYNRSSNEKIFDLLIRDALIERVDKELSEIGECEPHAFSKEFERNVWKIRNSIGRKERMKNAGRFSLKFFVTIATIMGIAFGGLLTQPTVYAAVTNVIRSVFDKFDRYDFSGSELTLENFNSEMRFRYIPDGYYLCSGTYSPVYVQLIYTNDNDEITFEYSIAKGVSLSLDNEHNAYETLYHNNNNIEYHYYESLDDDFFNSLIWYDKGYAFSIYAHLRQDEIVKIAENIK